MRKLITFIIPIIAVSQLGATDCGGVLRDTGFDLWCGDQLCAWKVERGDIKRVATWHESDSGVELLGEDTAIEQLSPVASRDGDCIKFDLIANVEDTAEVILAIDVEGDGTVEHTERIPTSHWKPLTYNLLFAKPFDGVRFELQKRGTGTAVLAQIKANLAKGECVGLTPIVAAPRPNGAACDDGTSCMSGICIPQSFGHVCAGCDPVAALCDVGQVCGFGDPTSPVLSVPTQCVPSAAGELGEHCLSGAECASGACVDETCSACDPAKADSCAPGITCGPSWSSPNHAPYICGAHQHAGTPGAACGDDLDCASAHCNGAEREQCDDGRACETAATCPVAIGLTPGHCTTVGIQGGSCQ